MLQIVVSVPMNDAHVNFWRLTSMCGFVSTKKIVGGALPSIYGYFTGSDNSHHALDVERASGCLAQPIMPEVS